LIVLRLVKERGCGHGAVVDVLEGFDGVGEADKDVDPTYERYEGVCDRHRGWPVAAQQDGKEGAGGD
jgi:hypothetical protein